MRKIGVFGGAFNPPTKAHAYVIKEALKTLDEIWIVPSYAHAFDKKPVSYSDRLYLLRKFKKNIKTNKKIKISKIEKRIFNNLNKENKKYVYTYDLLKALKKENTDCEFRFICGEDNAKKEVWNKFYKHKEIDQEFGKIIIKDIMPIRSTIVRELIKNKKENELSNYLFKNVQKQVKLKKLYN